MSLFLLFRPFRITKYRCPFYHVSKHCRAMPHNACIPRNISWELPWSVTVLKLQCVARHDESLTINRKGLGRKRSRRDRRTIPDFVWGLPVSKIVIPPGKPVFVRDSNPIPTKTQLHSVAATANQSAIVQWSHTLPLTLGTDMKTSVRSHAQHEKLSTLCTIHLLMLATNQMTFFCKFFEAQAAGISKQRSDRSGVRKFSELFNASPVYWKPVKHYLTL